MTLDRISVLYFDKDGHGPDCLYLEVFPIRGETRIGLEPALSLRVRAGEFVMRAEVDGGYFMERAQVQELRDALTKWLDNTPSRDGAEPPTRSQRDFLCCRPVDDGWCRRNRDHDGDCSRSGR